MGAQMVSCSLIGCFFFLDKDLSTEREMELSCKIEEPNLTDKKGNKNFIALKTKKSS